MVDTRRRAAKTAAQGGMLRAVIADDLAAVRGKVAKGSSTWWCPEGGLTGLHLAVVFASPAVLEALLAADMLRNRSLRARLVDARLTAGLTNPSVLHPLLESATAEQRLALGEGGTALHVAVHLGNPPAGLCCLAREAPHLRPTHPALQTPCACC